MGQDGRLVDEGACCEYLASSGWHVGGQLDREICQVGDPHRAKRLRDRGDVLEVGWVDNGFGVLDVACDIPVVRGGDPDVAVYEGRVGIVLGVAGERGKCIEPLIPCGDVVADEATPELALWEEAHVEGGDNAEIVRASTESLGEVGVAGRVCVDDFARGEDDLGRDVSG